MKFCRTRIILHPLCGLFLLVLLIPVLAHSEEMQPIEHLEKLIEKPKAARKSLKDEGILLEATNTMDVLSNVSGGIHQKTTLTGDLDLLLTLDIKKLIPNWRGTVFVYGLGLYGDNPSQYVGDIQGVSNIAAVNTWKLFEAWYQHNVFQRFSLLAGLYDVTSEFDVIMSASTLFVNSSFGTGAEFGASGKTGPSTFPSTSLGVRAQAILTDSLMVRAVVADGIPGNPDDAHGTQVHLRKDDGLFGSMELAYYQYSKEDLIEPKKEIVKESPRRLTFRRIGRSAPIEYKAKVAYGFWGYTTSLDHLNKVNSSGEPVKQHGTYGMYGLAEYDVYHEKEDTDQGLTLFGRAGMADPNVNRISEYYGGGFVYKGLFPGRKIDGTGMGVAVAVNSHDYKQSQRRAGQPVESTEITLELTHAIFVNQNLIIQPDFQYVINPGTVPGRNNAVVLGVRLEVNLNN
ncbi:MAG: carbohydrate porin [Nitrospirales bacterium]|nr:carbohydrate porin [Nitrospirales bacterium]